MVVFLLMRSIPLATLIIAIGYAIVFALGAIPIVVFLPSVFSQSKSGALHTPKVIFRKVETLGKKEKQETESIFPALSYLNP